MSFTLKLSHIAWHLSEGPYTWKYAEPVSGNPATEVTIGYSGPARFRGSDQDEVIQWVYDVDYDGQDEVPDFRFGPDHVLRTDDRLFVDTGAGVWEIIDHNSLPSMIDRNLFCYEGNPAHDVVTWISDVSQVVSLGDVDPSWKALRDALNGRGPRFSHLHGPGEGIEIHTWMGDEKKTVRKVIMVTFDSKPNRVMLVERAWLLGPNGDTVDKIAP